MMNTPLLTALLASHALASSAARLPLPLPRGAVTVNNRYMYTKVRRAESALCQTYSADINGIECPDTCDTAYLAISAAILNGDDVNNRMTAEVLNQICSSSADYGSVAECGCCIAADDQGSQFGEESTIEIWLQVCDVWASQGVAAGVSFANANDVPVALPTEFVSGGSGGGAESAASATESATASISAAQGVDSTSTSQAAAVTTPAAAGTTESPSETSEGNASSTRSASASAATGTAASGTTSSKSSAARARHVFSGSGSDTLLLVLTFAFTIVLAAVPSSAV